MNVAFTANDEKKVVEQPKAAEVKAEEPKKENKPQEAKKVEDKPAKKKPNIFIGGMGARPTGDRRPQGNNGQKSAQQPSNRPNDNKNNNNNRPTRGYTPIKPNVRTSASRLLDEEFSQQKGFKNGETNKPVAKIPVEETTQDIQNSNVPDRSVNGGDGDNRRSPELKEKTEEVRRPQNNGNQNRDNRDNRDNRNIIDLMVITRIGIIEIIETEEIIEVLRETIKIIETSRIMLLQIISQLRHECLCLSFGFVVD